MSAPEYSDDLAFGAPFVRDPRDVNQCAIAVHPFRCLVRRKKHVALDGIERLIRY